MKQSSKLLLASLLSINLATIAMDEAPAEPVNSIEAFKEEVRKLNFREFVMLSRTIDHIHETYHYGMLHLEASGFNIHVAERLVGQVALCELLKKSGPLYPILKKFEFPVAQFDELDAEFVPEGTSCIHPIVMSQFSAKFRELIKRKKNDIIQEKLQKGESTDNWTTSQKQLFGVWLFNSELGTLREEFMSTKRKISQYLEAAIQIKAEKGLEDQSIEELSFIVRRLEKNSMDFSNVEIIKINNATVIRRRAPKKDQETSDIFDEVVEKLKKEASEKTK
jgi:hypothetical protein